jgi:hypothetical protein
VEQGRAVAIHLIENDDRFCAIDFANDKWESPYWAVGEDVAKDLKDGGDIYFHKAQNAPSFFGGRVFDYRKQPDGQWAGRIIFLFVADVDHKNVKAQGRWSQEKKIVRESDV